VVLKIERKGFTKNNRTVRERNKGERGTEITLKDIKRTKHGVQSHQSSSQKKEKQGAQFAEN